MIKFTSLSFSKIIKENFSLNLIYFLLLAFFFQPQSIQAAPTLKCRTPNECKALLEKQAKNFLGARYSYGSASGKSFDCSGLVLTMVNSLVDHLPLPRSSQAMYGSLTQQVKLEDARMGDLLFFNTGSGVSHVGMYWGRDAKGNHLMYHASSSNGVEMRTLNGNQYWMSRLVGVKRVNLLSNALFNSIKLPNNGKASQDGSSENNSSKQQPKKDNKKDKDEWNKFMAKVSTDDQVCTESDLFENLSLPTNFNSIKAIDSHDSFSEEPIDSSDDMVAYFDSPKPEEDNIYVL